MKLRVISIGKVRQHFVLEGEAEYRKRLAPHLRLEILELDNEKHSSLPEPQIIDRDSDLLLSKIKKDGVLVVLDTGGKQLSSEKLASYIQKEMLHGTSLINFAIGGALGLNGAVKARADLLLSLSSFTFTYQLARLVLIEQLYRATTIIRGLPYHR